MFIYTIALNAMDAVYAACSIRGKRDRIVLMSRQGSKPSLDLRMLADELHRRLPQAEVVLCTTDSERKNMFAFIKSLFVMVNQCARSRVCVLESAIPSVSIPRHLDKQTRVVQIWHAFGAIKKFGYQSLDTPANYSSEAAYAMRMHRNYDYIVAAGPGAIDAYSKAFNYEPDRIVPLGLPRMDYLLDTAPESPHMRNVERLRQKHPCLADDAFKVLYVPTLRRGAGTEGWMTREVARLSQALQPCGCRLLVAGHPLDPGCDKEAAKAMRNVEFVPGAPSRDLLYFADRVVTDYSAISFEAALVGKPVYFYVPDIVEYRQSPGLNIDPLEMFPEGTFVDPDELAAVVSQEDTNASEAFSRFVDGYFEGIGPGSCSRVAEFIEECYRDTFIEQKGFK